MDRSLNNLKKYSDLEDAFQERMFPLDLIENLREISFEEHLYKEEDSNELQDLEKMSPTEESKSTMTRRMRVFLLFLSGKSKQSALH
jgi:hypothetical protein